MNKPLDFEVLYTAHQSSVYRLCLGYFGGNKPKADEVCQEVFIKVWKYMDTFEGKSQAGTWIYRIAVNTCLNALRSSKKSFKNVPIQDEFLSPVEHEHTDDEARLKSMYSCIEKLNPKDRTLILLVLEQEPYEKISEIMGLSENNLRVKIHRIKTKLSKCVHL
ncbi:RNA polymerase sigma factor [Psychroflexus montanilacus]|uniref:RNA polymerase sigma factor n=1 Tax=Psychroflexus montanilacus TaxID=2873598 RepID=UPI001CCFB0B5|nr:sigma-70 family RNA polymerase sigma factor [Psychroflexus montanilacus]MBZ9651898.1 sigma-70 family RNA polymerase sigma factor [Psychroflexus montanilacus]